MGRMCAVRGCNSESYPGCKLTFHAIPKSDMRNKWVRAVKLKPSRDKHMKICSLHFERTDYAGTRLKETAIPHDTTISHETSSDDEVIDLEQYTKEKNNLPTISNIVSLASNHCVPDGKLIGEQFPLGTINVRPKPLLMEIQGGKISVVKQTCDQVKPVCVVNSQPAGDGAGEESNKNPLLMQILQRNTSAKMNNNKRANSSCDTDSSSTGKRPRLKETPDELQRSKELSNVCVGYLRLPNAVNSIGIQARLKTPKQLQQERRVKALLQKISRQQKLVDHLKTKLSDVKAYASESHIENIIKDRFSDIRNMFNRKPNHRFSKEAQDFASKLYDCSPKAYDLVNEHVALPDMEILERYRAAQAYRNNIEYDDGGEDFKVTNDDPAQEEIVEFEENLGYQRTETPNKENKFKNMLKDRNIEKFTNQKIQIEYLETDEENCEHNNSLDDSKSEGFSSAVENEEEVVLEECYSDSC